MREKVSSMLFGKEEAFALLLLLLLKRLCSGIYDYYTLPRHSQHMARRSHFQARQTRSEAGPDATHPVPPLSADCFVITSEEEDDDHEKPAHQVYPAEAFGWSQDDFRQPMSPSCTSLGSPSLVSDDGTGATPLLPMHHHHHRSYSSLRDRPPMSPLSLDSKRRPPSKTNSVRFEDPDSPAYELSTFPLPQSRPASAARPSSTPASADETEQDEVDLTRSRGRKMSMGLGLNLSTISEHWSVEQSVCSDTTGGLGASTSTSSSQHSHSYVDSAQELSEAGSCQLGPSSSSGSANTAFPRPPSPKRVVHLES